MSQAQLVQNTKRPQKAAEITSSSFGNVIQPQKGTHRHFDSISGYCSNLRDLHIISLAPADDACKHAHPFGVRSASPKHLILCFWRHSSSSKAQHRHGCLNDLGSTLAKPFKAHVPKQHRTIRHQKATCEATTKTMMVLILWSL